VYFHPARSSAQNPGLLLVIGYSLLRASYLVRLDEQFFSGAVKLFFRGVGKDGSAPLEKLAHMLTLVVAWCSG